VAKTSLVSMAVFSVVLPISDAPDCSGTIVVEMFSYLSSLTVSIAS
jgi:hypothetical protein